MLYQQAGRQAGIHPHVAQLRSIIVVELLRLLPCSDCELLLDELLTHQAAGQLLIVGL
jgi:hypothetical protein